MFSAAIKPTALCQSSWYRMSGGRAAPGDSVDDWPEAMVEGGGPAGFETS